MTPDPIIEELHRIREQLAQQFNYDVFAIVADAQAQQAREDHPVISFAKPRNDAEESATETPQQIAA